ncbi:MAG: T9SS C-terminal target domain-containing protein [Flavobacteriales bacterium]
MKRMKKTNWILAAGLSVAISANAWNPPATGSNMSTGDNSIVNRAANCAPAVALTYLEYNNVRALIETGGSMWQDRANNRAAYQIPKPPQGGVGPSSIYAGALWLGGVDVNNQLKLAAHQFRRGNDFWTGPLSVIYGTGNNDDKLDFGPAEIDPNTCQQYDRFYVTTRNNIAEFRAWWLCSQDPDCDASEEFPDYQVPQSILTWPAHGDISKFQDFYLAPFFDNDGPNGLNGIYDPINDGDYPFYDLDNAVDCKTSRRVTLYGDINYWWIFNDKGNVHTETNGAPIGMEIKAQAFAFATNDEINNMTFFNFELINRSTQTLFNTYFGNWVDADVGCSEDDYVGCDVSRGLGYAFNADAVDDDGCQGAIPYGANPPAVGVDFFEGPYQDNDGIDNAIGIGPGEAVAGNGIGYGDGIIDNERFGMRRFFYTSRPIGGGTVPFYMQDPVVAPEYYNYLRGIWRDGVKFVYGGTGHPSSTGATTIETDFTFPDDSDQFLWGTNGVNPGFPWSEITENNPKGDRRFLQSAGPFTLEPGALNNITVGIVWARALGGDLMASVRLLKSADDKAQSLFDNCFRVLDGPDAPDVTIQELDRELIIYLSNSPQSNNSLEDYGWDTSRPDGIDPTIITPPDELANGIIWDNRYRFQGYQIYQVKNASVSVTDVNDTDLARIVAQCDRKDNVVNLVNFTFDESINASIPMLMVEAENKGIKHSFKITNDLFAQGNSRLINHKKYYYIAVAYAHNEYKKYDQNNPLALDGQKKPYLSGRKSPTGSIRSYVGIPHIPVPEQNGTVQNAQYGDGFEITRIEGMGNGFNSVDLSPASENSIVANFKLDEVTYKAGKGPINVKVVDPLNVVAGNFLLKFKTTLPNVVNSGQAIDTANWELINLGTGEKVTSKSAINIGSEQVIPEWGISVTIEQYKYLNVGSSTFFSDLIESEVVYDNPNRRWLGGVPDVDGLVPQNWIRSGTADVAAANDPCGARYNDRIGLDDGQVYEKVINGTWAPFALTATSNIPNTDDCEPNHAPINQQWAGMRNANDLRSAVSVDIVFTPDKSKWTRCVVLEAQQTQALAGGSNGVAHLYMKNRPSVDKNGRPTGSPGCNEAEAQLTGLTGMGWFPGYAIEVETGERMNMAFAEDTWIGADNGNDMMFNPTSRMYSTLGDVIWGGKHFVYVFRNTAREPNTESALSTVGMVSYDNGAYIYNAYATNSAASLIRVWRSCSWVGIPMVEEGQTFLSTTARVKLRTARPYRRYATKGYHLNNDADTVFSQNKWINLYRFSTGDKATEFSTEQQWKDSILNLINVVPNPYYAYSNYEENRLDNRIKITNLPDIATIKIYTINGTLVRTITKDSPITSVDWDLKNFRGIPIASGAYLIHVNVPEVGEKVLKWFGVIRPPDLDNF